jgi:hypothetical protein
MAARPARLAQCRLTLLAPHSMSTIACLEVRLDSSSHSHSALCRRADAKKVDHRTLIFP